MISLRRKKHSGNQMIHVQNRIEYPEIAGGSRFRARKRYDHASILLWIRDGGEGTGRKRIRAYCWNEKGFNFHFDQEINGLEFHFSKGAFEFSGNPVWALKSDDEEAILEIILNNSLTRKLKQLPEDDLIRRTLSMVRTRGLLDEKKKLLAYLGCEISSDDEQLLIQSYKMKYPYNRYGVRVESDAWSEIVRETLALTSVVDTLDQMDVLIKDIQDYAISSR